jgi:transposase
MTLDVQAVRQRYGVGEHTILGWIRSGELKAINVARGAGKRPKWRITSEALAAFELKRESGSTAPKATRRRKRLAEPTAYY